MWSLSRFRFGRLDVPTASPEDFCGYGETHRSIRVQAVIHENQPFSLKIFARLSGRTQTQVLEHRFSVGLSTFPRHKQWAES
jgi:hypothetical protein